MLYGPWGPEAMLTVSRTFSSPRHAIGQSTYVGLEVGYQLLAHVSLGFAQQVDVGSTRLDADLECRLADPVRLVAVVNAPTRRIFAPGLCCPLEFSPSDEVVVNYFAKPAVAIAFGAVFLCAETCLHAASTKPSRGASC